MLLTNTCSKSLETVECACNSSAECGRQEFCWDINSVSRSLSCDSVYYEEKVVSSGTTEPHIKPCHSVESVGPLPIEISNENSTTIDLPPISWHGYDCIPKFLAISNTGRKIVINGNWTFGKPYIEGGPLNGIYLFSHIHFHCPSEHKIDGVRYPLEMHVVHYKTSYLTQERAMEEKDGTVVLVYLIQVKDKCETDLSCFMSHSSQINEVKNESEIFDIPLSHIVKPFYFHYYVYWGSLSTQKNSFVLQWIINCTTLCATEQEVHDLFRLLEPDSRSEKRAHLMKPLNDAVYYVGENFSVLQSNDAATQCDHCSLNLDEECQTPCKCVYWELMDKSSGLTQCLDTEKHDCECQEQPKKKQKTNITFERSRSRSNSKAPKKKKNSNTEDKKVKSNSEAKTVKSKEKTKKKDAVEPKVRSKSKPSTTKSSECDKNIKNEVKEISTTPGPSCQDPTVNFLLTPNTLQSIPSFPMMTYESEQIKKIRQFKNAETSVSEDIEKKSIGTQLSEAKPKKPVTEFFLQTEHSFQTKKKGDFSGCTAQDYKILLMNKKDILQEFKGTFAPNELKIGNHKKLDLIPKYSAPNNIIMHVEDCTVKMEKSDKLHIKSKFILKQSDFNVSQGVENKLYDETAIESGKQVNPTPEMNLTKIQKKDGINSDHLMRLFSEQKSSNYMKEKQSQELGQVIEELEKPENEIEFVKSPKVEIETEKNYIPKNTDQSCEAEGKKNQKSLIQKSDSALKSLLRKSKKIIFFNNEKVEKDEVVGKKAIMEKFKSKSGFNSKKAINEKKG